MITFAYPAVDDRELKTDTDVEIHCVLGPGLYILGPKLKTLAVDSMEYFTANHVAGLVNRIDAVKSLIAQFCDMSFMKKAVWTTPND